MVTVLLMLAYVRPIIMIESVSPFRADSNLLSNFFKCSIDFNGRAFKSSGHIYQFTKCMFLKHDDLANLIDTTETPRDVNALSDKLNKHERMAEWSNIKVDVMHKILRAKWNCSGRFRQTLMATSNLTTAETTSDTFWGVGVAPQPGSTHQTRTFSWFKPTGEIVDGFEE